MTWLVTVSERRNEEMTECAAIEYTSPPHETEEHARALVALITGSAMQGDGPWRQGIAGGQRTIQLRRASHAERRLR